MDRLRVTLLGSAISVCGFGIDRATAEPITLAVVGTIAGLAASSSDRVDLGLDIPFTEMFQYDTTALGLSGSTPTLFNPDDLVLLLHVPTDTALTAQRIPAVHLNLFTNRQVLVDGSEFDTQNRSPLADIVDSIDSVPIDPEILLLIGLGCVVFVRLALRPRGAMQTSCATRRWRGGSKVGRLPRLPGRNGGGVADGSPSPPAAVENPGPPPGP
jgi:hypothetical protein